MRHLSMAELLAAVEGEASAGELQHLQQCSHCSSGRRQLLSRQAALRALPRLCPAHDAWPAIRNSIVRQKRRRRIAVSMALAAALVFLALIPVLLQRPGRIPDGPDALAALVERSQLLEERLRSIPEPTMLDVASADTLVELEDQIAFIDQCLDELPAEATREELTLLWQSRVELLEALMNLRTPALALVSH